MNQDLTAGSQQDPRLGISQNPQTSGGQDLSSSGAGLQNSTNIIDNSQNLQITSVGTSDNIQAADIQSASVTNSQSNTMPSAGRPYGIIAAIIVVVIVSGVVTWITIRKPAD